MFFWPNTSIILLAEDYQEILAKFSSNRAQLPALFIATPKDKFTSIWTKEKPSKQVSDLCLGNVVWPSIKRASVTV